jgi:hypothetical protein
MCRPRNQHYEIASYDLHLWLNLHPTLDQLLPPHARLWDPNKVQWDARKVECRQCQAVVNASSLSCHLADLHEVYQQTVVAEELLDDRVGVSYRATTLANGKIPCPFPGCVGESGSSWMLWRHFRDVHPRDLVIALKEQQFPCCKRCGMQVNFAYPRHTRTKECAMGIAR